MSSWRFGQPPWSSTRPSRVLGGIMQAGWAMFVSVFLGAREVGEDLWMSPDLVFLMKFLMYDTS